MIASSLSICLPLLAVVASAFSHGIPLQRGLGSTCQTDTDCIRIPHSFCSPEKSCDCLAGYNIDGSLTRCLKVAYGYYDSCEESVQCSAYLGAGGTCLGARCVCSDGHHYLHGRCHETKGLGEACTNNYECFVNATYEASSCIEGKCECSRGFYQREYSTCRPLAEKVGDDCLIDQDCGFDEGATCVANKCALGEEEILVFDLKVERRVEPPPSNDKNIVIGVSECKNNDDCKSLHHSICAVNNTCVCDRGYFATRRNPKEPDFKDGCAPEIGTNCDPKVKEEFQIDSASCKNNAWTCDFNRVATKDNQLCEEMILELGATCFYVEQCQLFGPRAARIDKECRCNETISHWIEKEKFCWKTSKVGEACERDYDCHSRGVGFSPMCRSKVCSCPEGSTAGDEEGNYCVGEEPELGFYCEKDADCEKIPNASCENNECACAETFFELDEKCVAGLNAICEIDDDCKLINTTCYPIDETQKSCRCAESFTVGPDDLCIEKSQYQKKCTYDVQCTAAVKNTFCNGTSTIEHKKEEEEEKDADDDNEEDVTGRCECVADYYFNRDGCYLKKYLGQECTRQGECFTPSSTSVCRNGVCSCEFDFVQVGNECKSKNASPGLLNFPFWLVPLAVILTTAIP